MERETRASVILDLILANKEELVEELKVESTLSASDHEILEFILLRKRKDVCSQTYRFNFRIANFNRLIKLCWDKYHGQKYLQKKELKKAGSSCLLVHLSPVMLGAFLAP